MNDPRFSSSTLAGPVSRTSADAAEFAGRVYGWVAAGVLASAFTAYAVQHNPSFQASAEKHITLWILLPFVPLLALAFAGTRMGGVATAALYLVFTAVEGVSLGVIVSYYTTSTVALAFTTTAGLFGAMAVIGTVTKRDLTRMGPLLICALLGLIIASFANIFFASTTLMWVISYLGIAIFLGFTAYDAQRVKQLALAGETGTNSAVMCATALYLDILNLFLFLLSIFGNR
jgi:uncharacterized protein